MTKKQKAIVTAIAFIMIPPLLDAKTFTGSHRYTMSDHDSKADGRAAAIAGAKRKIMEQVGTLVTSSTEVKNGKLVEDRVKSISGGVIPFKTEEEKLELNDGVLSYWVKGTSEIDVEAFHRTSGSTPRKTEKISPQCGNSVGQILLAKEILRVSPRVPERHEWVTKLESGKTLFASLDCPPELLSQGLRCLSRTRKQNKLSYCLKQVSKAYSQ